MHNTLKGAHITIIAAHTSAGVIGRAGTLPWHVPSDLQRFKQLTMGKDVIVGRTTFESIVRHNKGKIPGGRRFIMLTRTCILCNDVYATAVTFEEAVLLANRSPEIFVAGGASVYQEALPFAQRMHLSEIHIEEPGDTHFPEWDKDEWRCAFTYVSETWREPKVTHRIWERK